MGVIVLRFSAEGIRLREMLMLLLLCWKKSNFPSRAVLLQNCRLKEPSIFSQEQSSYSGHLGLCSCLWFDLCQLNSKCSDVPAWLGLNVELQATEDMVGHVLRSIQMLWLSLWKVEDQVGLPGPSVAVHAPSDESDRQGDDRHGSHMGCARGRAGPCLIDVCAAAKCVAAAGAGWLNGLLTRRQRTCTITAT
jgi:hypothetical protein